MCLLLNIVHACIKHLQIINYIASKITPTAYWMTYKNKNGTLQIIYTKYSTEAATLPPTRLHNHSQKLSIGGYDSPTGMILGRLPLTHQEKEPRS